MDIFDKAFTGSFLDTLLKRNTWIPIPPNADLNDYNSFGRYGSANTANTATLQNVPSDPDDKENDRITGSFTLYVFSVNGVETALLVQLVISSDRSAFYYRIKGNNGWSKIWFAIPLIQYGYKHKGTTAQRPNLVSNYSPRQNKFSPGFFYFDTDLNSGNGLPIWWTGDTSNGKTGWVDATGATV